MAQLCEPRWQVFGRRIIGKRYLVRYTLLKTPWFGLYLHHFLGSDPEPCLHDHPWQFASLILMGAYCEVTESRLEGGLSADWFQSGRLLLRGARHRHRIVLGHGQEAWTLVLTGRRRDTWGFFPRGEFKGWQQYIAEKE